MYSTLFTPFLELHNPSTPTVTNTKKINKEKIDDIWSFNLFYWNQEVDPRNLK